MGPTVHIQPVFYRVLGACTMVFAVLGVGSFIVARDWPALAEYAPWVALLGVVGYEGLWAPYLEVSDGGVTMRNVLRTVRLPWPAIHSVEGKYGLDGLYVGVPTMIGANGVEEVIEIALDDEAKQNFQVSVDAVKELLEACKQIDGSLA